MKEKTYEPTLEQTFGWQRFLAKIGTKVRLGNGRREGWTGELPFYLFWCRRCKKFGIDYKHGFEPYLVCEKCEVIIRF